MRFCLVLIFSLALFSESFAVAKKVESTKDWNVIFDKEKHVCIIETEAKRVRGEYELGDQKNYFYVKKVGENEYTMGYSPSEPLVENTQVVLELDARFYSLEMVRPSKIYTFSSIQDVEMLNLFLLADWKYFLIRVNIDPHYKNVLYFSLDGFIPAMKKLAKCKDYREGE